MTKFKKFGVVIMLSSLLTNGTFSVEYSIGNLNIGYEKQIDSTQQNEKNDVTGLSRKASNSELEEDRQKFEYIEYLK